MFTSSIGQNPETFNYCCNFSAYFLKNKFLRFAEVDLSVQTDWLCTENWSKTSISDLTIDNKINWILLYTEKVTCHFSTHVERIITPSVSGAKLLHATPNSNLVIYNFTHSSYCDISSSLSHFISLQWKPIQNIGWKCIEFSNLIVNCTGHISRWDCNFTKGTDFYCIIKLLYQGNSFLLTYYVSIKCERNLEICYVG